MVIYDLFLIRETSVVFKARGSFLKKMRSYAEVNIKQIKVKLMGPGVTFIPPCLSCPLFLKLPLKAPLGNSWNSEQVTWFTGL